MNFHAVGGTHKALYSPHTLLVHGQRIMQVAFTSPTEVVIITEAGSARGPAREIIPSTLLRALRAGRGRMLPPEFQTTDKTYDQDSTVDDPFKPGPRSTHPKEEALRSQMQGLPTDHPDETDPQINQKLKDEQKDLHPKEKQMRQQQERSAGFEVNKVYMAESSGDKIYIYGTEVQKNGSLKGFEVHKFAGRKPERAKKASFSGYHGFKTVDAKDVPPDVVKRFEEVGIHRSRTASVRQADDKGQQLRQIAYNYAKSIPEQAEDWGDNTVRMATEYFNLTHKSGSEEKREKAAKKMVEAMRIEIEACETHSKVCKHIQDIFEKVQPEHHAWIGKEGKIGPVRGVIVQSAVDIEVKDVDITLAAADDLDNEGAYDVAVDFIVRGATLARWLGVQKRVLSRELKAKGGRSILLHHFEGRNIDELLKIAKPKIARIINDDAHDRFGHGARLVDTEMSESNDVHEAKADANKEEVHYTIEFGNQVRWEN